jgi:hypothetical protein
MVCPCNIFQSMRMKEKICLTGLLLETNPWCITANPESKRASLQWKHPSSPSTKKLKQTSKDFYAADFDALVKRWDECINVGGRNIVNIFFQIRISHVLYFILNCGLFTDSPSYVCFVVLRVSWEASLYRDSLLGNSSVARHPAPT